MLGSPKVLSPVAPGRPVPCGRPSPGAGTKPGVCGAAPDKGGVVKTPADSGSDGAPARAAPGSVAPEETGNPLNAASDATGTLGAATDGAPVGNANASGRLPGAAVEPDAACVTLLAAAEVAPNRLPAPAAMDASSAAFAAGLRPLVVSSCCAASAAS